MAGRAEFSLRPRGFPFTEEDYRNLRQERMKQVITGQFCHRYDEWTLRGTPTEPLFPTVAIAIFPTPVLTPGGCLLEPEALIINDDHRKIVEYWQDAAQIPLTERVIAYEQRYFPKGLIERGDAMLFGLQSNLMTYALPTVLMLFCRPPGSPVESAYFICPNTVPPSATHRHLQEQARIHSFVQ